MWGCIACRLCTSLDLKEYVKVAKLEEIWDVLPVARVSTLFFPNRMFPGSSARWSLEEKGAWVEKERERLGNLAGAW